MSELLNYAIIMIRTSTMPNTSQGRIQKFFEGGVLKFFCMDGKF